jgi:hypothetical protein
MSAAEGAARVGAFANELPARTFAVIERACRELGAELRLLAGSHDEPPDADVSVLVGWLAPGERRIRPHYLERARRSHELSLLLLSEDELVRPTISLEEGRVTLIGHGSPALMRGRLRMLLAGLGAREPALDERASARFWAADTRERGLLAEAFATSVTLDFCCELGRANAGLDGEAWRIDWPERVGSLLLVSPLRLPQVTDLGRAHGGQGERRLRAESGDVLLLLASGERAWSGDAWRSLSGQSELGGPVIFDWACSHFGPAGARVAVVEVR